MTTLYKLLTGPDQGAEFCHKVSKNLSQGWMLYGSPSISFDTKQGVMICSQAVTKDIEGEYDPDKALSEQS